MASTAIGVVVFAGCDGGVAPDEMRGPAQARVSRSFETEIEQIVIHSGGEVFDAVVEAPVGGSEWGVLMIGGGLGNTLNWDVPGELTHDGVTMRFTISGASHADAPLLSGSLAGRGFAVLRWNTIARGDPLAAEWPMRSTPRTQGELVGQARQALASLRTEVGRAERVVLLGHSQGAMRACALANEDGRVAGLILLSPAYFTRDERAAALLSRDGIPFGEDVVRRCGIPTLAIFGALDNSPAVNADAALMLMSTPGFEHFTVHVLPGVGHQLGAQEGDRFGPIDASVLRIIEEWSDQIVETP